MNEEQLSTILDNLLGLLLLEGSYEIEEKEDSFFVFIDTQDAGRLIGGGGETLHSLQSLVNQMVSKKSPEGTFKRVVVDVAGWRKQKEEEIAKKAEEAGKEVLESGKEIELEPMNPWQRRLVHMVISEIKGLETESVGEGIERRVMIKVKGEQPKSKNEDSEAAES